MKRTDITALFPDATKDQIDKIMDLAGEDVNKAKGDLATVQGQLSAAQAELQALKAKPADSGQEAKIQALQDELAGLKLANTLRDLREKVSKETGVPASLLTAETEEACKTQAEAIKAFKDEKPGYPQLKDAGEVRTPGSSSARDKFADWMSENFPAKN